ncbi:MAG TPA: ArsR family transcriptional regulator [Candidatus Nanopusillus sp.]|nr:ArsR family transcriptional regulator [Candidatus Nanopusillus sp.]HIP90631.1 ArsR family transcriptional regulator [Candidatus Nanopusillus sp.]
MSLKVFRALANETRYKIIKILLENDSCLGNLSRFFNKDFSVLYRHVKELEEAGLVEVKKVGRLSIICIKNKDIIRKLVDLASQIEKQD